MLCVDALLACHEIELFIDFDRNIWLDGTPASK